MSEEQTEVIRTVAVVSVNAKATPQGADSERLARLLVHLGRTAATLKEIVELAVEARDRLEGSPTDIDGLRAFECVEQILRMASAALKAQTPTPDSETQEKCD